MEFAPLTPTNQSQWAELLAICFDRTQEDMLALLDWLHQMGSVVAWGAWDGDKLVAQYTSLIRHLSINNTSTPAGMSINMAVHPDYRGQGLVKQVSAPVYEEVQRCGAVLGFGFSNAEGVKVDRHSKSYGYQVLGEMQSLLSYLPKSRCDAVQISDEFPADICFACVDDRSSLFHFYKTIDTFRIRYGNHPFRQYKYGIWYENCEIYGVVVYREIERFGFKGVSLMDACGRDLTKLIRNWACTMRNRNFRFIHTLTTPDAGLAKTLRQHYRTISLPYINTPYYLTMRPLSDNLDPSLKDFMNWDFVGGDIL